MIICACQLRTLINFLRRNDYNYMCELPHEDTAKHQQKCEHDVYGLQTQTLKEKWVTGGTVK